MKSKSRKGDEGKSRAFDFVNLYKKADETIVKLKEHEELNDSSKFTKKSNKHRIKLSNKPNFLTKPVVERSTSELNIDTSKKDKATTKSIIRNSENHPDPFTAKPKKRNKSVSFILDENEEVKVKRTKSEAFTKDNRYTKDTEVTKSDKTGKKKLKTGNTDRDKYILKDSTQVSGKNQENINIENNETVKKKRSKELRKLQKEEHTEQDIQTLPENVMESNNVQEKKSKRKKKKLLSKTIGDTDTNECEPAIKSRKKDVKPEAVVQDLENLNIGDNTHTLTNLLDEMVVVDKKKQKKKKNNQNKGNQPVTTTSSPNTMSEQNKLKEKWKKKRWNKDKKPLLFNKHQSSSVTVDNLPNSIILNYKKLLSEHFSKCGVIKKIGVAEIYLTDNPKPVFSTTIMFDNQDATLKALEEDNTSFEGNIIRIKQRLPPNKTTLVVRSYGEMTEHALSSAFNSAGRIRQIQIIVKKKKTMGTAFIEFDGPAALDRSLQIAEDIKIGGKNIHLSKFEFQRNIKPDEIKKAAVSENDVSSDSSDE